MDNFKLSQSPSQCLVSGIAFKHQAVDCNQYIQAPGANIRSMSLAMQLEIILCKNEKYKWNKF